MSKNEIYRVEIPIIVDDQTEGPARQVEERMGRMATRAQKDIAITRKHFESLAKLKIEPVMQVKDQLTNSVLQADRLVKRLGMEKASPLLEAQDRISAVVTRVDAALKAVDRGDVKVLAEMQGPLLDEIVKAKASLKALDGVRAGPVAELRGELFGQLTKAFAEARKLDSLMVEPQATLRERVIMKAREIGSSLRQLTSQAWSVTVSVKDKVTSSIRGIVDGAKRMLASPLGLLGVGISGAAAVQVGIRWPLKLADDLTKAQVGFETLLGSESAARAFMDELKQFAVTSSFDDTPLYGYAQSLLAFQFPREEIIPLIEAIGDTAGAFALGEDKIESMVTAFGRMRITGKASARELNMLAYANVNVWEMLAKGLGKTAEQVQEMVKDGELSAKTATRVIVAGMQEAYGGQMAKLADRSLGVMVGNIKDAFNVAFLQRWGLGIQTAVLPKFRAMDQWFDKNAKSIEHWGDTLEQFGRNAGNSMTDFVGKLADIGRSVAFGIDATTYASSLRERVNAEHDAAVEVGRKIEEQLASAWALPELTVPGIANVLGTANIAGKQSMVHEHLGSLLGSSREQIESLQEAYSTIGASLEKLAQSTPDIMLPEVEMGKEWERFNEIWESVGGKSSLNVAQLQQIMEKVQQIMPQPRELSAMEKAWDDLEKQLFITGKTYAAMTVVELQEIIPKLELEQTSVKMLREEIERILKLDPVQLKRLGIDRNSVDNVTMMQLENALGRRAELERLTLPLLGDVVPYLNMDELEALATKIEQKGELRARFEAVWDLVVWEPLKAGIDKLIEWLNGPGASKFAEVFTTLGKVAAESYIAGMKALGSKTVEELKEGNIKGAAVPAAAMYLLGGAAIVRGAWGLGKGVLQGGRWLAGKLPGRIPGTAGRGITGGISVGETTLATTRLPRMPKFPRLPKMPTMPTMPTMPKIPKLPTLPKLPKMPKIPLGSLGAIARRVALPLALGLETYDVIKAQDKTKAITQGATGLISAATGAKMGAALGTTILPGIGTAIGGFLGAGGGYLTGRWAGGKAVDMARGPQDAMADLAKSSGVVSEQQERIARTGQVYLDSQGNVITSNGFVINSQNNLMQAFATLVEAVDYASAKLIAFSGIELLPPAPGMGDFKLLDRYATGGILTRPHLGLVAEAGPEAIIPLSTGMRSRALELWAETGKRLGVDAKIRTNIANLAEYRNIKAYASGGFAGAMQSMPMAAGGWEVPASAPLPVMSGAATINLNFDLAGLVGQVVIENRDNIDGAVDNIAGTIADNLRKVFQNMTK